MLYIIIAILAFGFLIAIHEFGHFVTAKLSGIRVNEFSIGMGPKLLSKQKGETLYSLRLFPMGGFCAMEGEDDSSADPRSFQSKPWWKKLIVLVAGSAMNFLAGLVILLFLFSQVYGFHVEEVKSFEAWSILPSQGLQAGDRFLKIDGHRILTYGDAYTFLTRAEGLVDITVERDGQKLVLKDVDTARQSVDGTSGLLGLNLGAAVVEATVGSRVKAAVDNSIAYVRLVWMSLGDLVTGQVGVQDLSGPIGIVDMVSDVGSSPDLTAEAKLNTIANLIAFIAVNLAVMNLLPIPALDGGRIFFLAVNGAYTVLTRKKLNPKYEGYVNVAGFLCLILLMIVVAFNDVMKVIG